jgi:hypothetical protein
MANELMSYAQQQVASPGFTTQPYDIAGLSVANLVNRVKKLKEIKQEIMEEGVHYGVIPGSQKPFLWKAGAELLACAFRLTPVTDSNVVLDDPEMERIISVPIWVPDPANPGKNRKTFEDKKTRGYYEVISTCIVYAPDGSTLAKASGTCNNAESKFNNQPYYDAKNSVLKRAEKRAMNSAILIATGGSGLFLEEDDDGDMKPSSQQNAGSYSNNAQMSTWPSDSMCKLLFAKGKDVGADVEVVKWLIQYFRAQGKAKALNHFQAIADGRPAAAKVWAFAAEKYEKNLAKPEAPPPEHPAESAVPPPPADNNDF